MFFTADISRMATERPRDEQKWVRTQTDLAAVFEELSAVAAVEEEGLVVCYVGAAGREMA